jgi:hypothetical protein
MTYTRYIVEDADGNEACSTAFEESEYTEARDYASKIGGRVVAHEYEWTDSEVVDDFTQSSEPDEGDITTSDYRHWYQYGKLVLTVGPDEDYEQAVREYMDESEFWPNVWSISDHGNACLLNLYE